MILLIETCVGLGGVRFFMFFGWCRHELFKIENMTS